MPKENPSKQQQLAELIEKLNFLRQHLVLVMGTDPSGEFRTRKEIEALEKEIAQLQAAPKTLIEKDLLLEEPDVRDEIRRTNPRVEEFGKLYYVNCDRRESWSDFQDKFFEDFADLPIQFYFISACRSQSPDGFTKRLIYEIENEYQDLDNAIFYPNTDQKEPKIEQLKVELKQKHTRRVFTKSVSKHLELGRTSIDRFLKTGKPRKAYQYILLPYFVDEQAWEDFMPAFFQEVIDTFKHKRKTVPIFIFIFVVYIKDLHTPEKWTKEGTTIQTALRQLARQNPGNTAHLDPLPPVKLNDIEQWLISVGEKTPNKLKYLMRLVRQQRELTEADRRRYDEMGLVDMVHVERFQQAVMSVGDTF